LSSSVIGLYSTRAKPFGVRSHAELPSKPMPVTWSSGSHRRPAKYSHARLPRLRRNAPRVVPTHVTDGDSSAMTVNVVTGTCVSAIRSATCRSRSNSCRTVTLRSVSRSNSSAE
jgi:hypothetical protein